MRVVCARFEKLRSFFEQMNSYEGIKKGSRISATAFSMGSYTIYFFWNATSKTTFTSFSVLIEPISAVGGATL